MLNLHKLFSAATLAALTLAPLASAQSLTTLYARNNGGSFGGAVYFDVTVMNPGGIVVTSLDTNTLETVPMGLSVYTAMTTHVGNELNLAAWTLVASGNGVGQGANIPTPVDISDFGLAPGSHGIALVMSATAGHDYTNGTGTNQVYSNNDIQINCGTASNVPFSGGIFNPRVWNGTIYYSGAGNNVASYGQFGSGCLGSNALAPELTGTLPKIGNPFTVSVGNLPATSPVAFMVFGFSKTSWAGGTLPLPYALGVIGAPGCDLLVNPNLAVGLPNVSGTASTTVPIANSPVLLFKPIYNQAFVVDIPANNLGVISSNGGEGVIGM